jgi:FkbM family methyltransferase
MILYLLRRIISFLLRYSPSDKFSDILLWPVSKRLFGHGYTEIVTISNGLKMKVYGDMEDMVNKLIMFTSQYVPLAWEPGTARLVEKLSVRSRCVVVAGSHIGYYPLIIGHTNHNAEIYAFEPNPLNRERCKENIALNKLNNVRVYDEALGDVIGVKKMYFDFGQSSFINSGRSHAGDGVVKINTLDKFFEQNTNKPDLIILDAEGYESKILEGGKEIISQNHPTIIFEMNLSALNGSETSPDAITQFLLERGYTLFVIDEGTHGLNFNKQISIKLVPYANYDIKKMSFVNVLAIIDTNTIQEYVNTI